MHLIKTNTQFRLDALVAPIILAAMSCTSAINAECEKILRLLFVINILCKPNKQRLTHFINKIPTPYLVFDSSFTLLKHGFNANKLLFFYPENNISGQFNLLTTEKLGNARSIFYEVFKNPRLYENGRFTCQYNSILDTNLQEASYSVNYFKMERNIIFASFQYVQPEFINQNQNISDQSRVTLSLSHELRNPLNGIVGVLSQLKKTASTKIKPLVLTGLYSACLLRYKLDSFIDLAQLSTKQLTLSLTEINMDKLASKINKLFAFYLKEGVAFLINKDSLLPTKFYQDEDRLMQLLVKLIANSFKYTAKGFIKLNISLTDSNQILFSVSDTGCGMTAPNIAKIRKLSKMAKSDQSNPLSCEINGLGLLTVQLLLEKMGSQLQIYSILGEGTQMAFKIMIEEASSPVFTKYRKQYRHSATSIVPFQLSTDDTIPDEISEDIGIMRPSSRLESSQSINVPNKNILSKITSTSHKTVNVMVVDDCNVNRMVHKMLLARYKGAKISEHCNGLEAVEYIKTLSGTSEVVMILMDINMPVMNGIEATRVIRSLSMSQAVFIIAVSAFSDENEISKVYECGMNFHITKPVTKESIAKIMNLIN
jgi:signal transduction histidine kinase/CheY-like chemotaxis protein